MEILIMLPYYQVLVFAENDKGVKTCKYKAENKTKVEAEKEKLVLVKNIEKNLENVEELERQLIIYKKKEIELRYFNRYTREFYCKYYVQIKRYTLLQLLNIKL